MSRNVSGFAVITGAASGMGEAAARLMSDAGWELLLLDLNADRLSQVAQSLKAGATVATLAGDICSQSFRDEVASKLNGQVGAFIHCAGLSPTMAGPARILEVNLAATMRMVDLILPRIAPGGAAVLFASTAAHMVGTAMDQQITQVTRPEDIDLLSALCPDSGAAYAVSKRGVVLLVQRLAADFGQRDARIVSISPGIIDTPMGRSELEKQPIMKTLVERSALKRAARPDEVAAVAVFLCSRAASFISGTDILVDGGSIAAMRK